MSRFSGFWRGLALAALFSAPAYAEGESASTVVATVNGTVITLGEMIAMRETLPEQYQSMADDVLFKGILDQLVQQEVLRQSITEMSPRNTAVLSNEARGYISGIAMENVALVAVTDEALQAAYDARFKDAAPQTEYHAAHILVKTAEEADAIKADLAAGGDFAEIAMTKSIDTGSGSAGGDLGWFGLGMMVKPFEDAVVAAKVGEVSGPIQTEFGYHLILVQETRIAANPTLDQLRDDLAQEIERTAVDALIADLSGKAAVTREGEGIDPAILKNTALID